MYLPPIPMPSLKAICLFVLQHLILNRRKIYKEGGCYNKGNNKYAVIENLKYQRGLKLSLLSALSSSFLPPSPFCFVLSVCLWVSEWAKWSGLWWRCNRHPSKKLLVLLRAIVFAAVMIRFNLGRTFCAVVWGMEVGGGVEKNTLPRSALLLCSGD